MKKIFIVSAKRTAIGSFLGSLSTVHPADFGAVVVEEIMKETNVPASDIDEVIVGNILPAGQGQGVARQISIKAGIPKEIPAYGVNMVCGSGMKAIMNGVMSIKAGWHNLVISGGTESMSRAPFLIPERSRSGMKFGDFTVKDHMVYDALTDAFENYHMGITAENIVKQYKITREEQDQFAYHSQQKALKAIEVGRFKDEIVPIEVHLRKETIVFDTDEFPNPKSTPEKLAKLRPAFLKGGTVTAGNSSGINDGASFVMLASEDAVLQYGLKPLVEVVAVGQGGVDPSVMGLGPVPAISNVLKSANMTLNEIDLFELNEAFAAQSIGVLRELSKEHNMTQEEIMSRTNINGGAIALGHPVGASGNRITVTLIHEMLKRKVKYGLASLCIGGGMGTALILKRVEE